MSTVDPQKADFPAKNETLFVIGNGPSLRGFDFCRLSGRPSLGMNAAFRYWDRIDWRPTHYACLDDALIDTHKTDIMRLVKEAKIQSFFLSGQILEHFPDLVDRENVVILDSFVPYWHRERGAKYGVPSIESPAFHTQSPNLLTTGAYCVRYGAYLGYSKIALLGIDLDYQPIPEAEATEGDRLIVRETPEQNVNYFFDDYQREGDVFHVPNPDSHDQELHVAAFAAVRDDFQREEVGVQVWNTNPASRLNSDGIFPFQDLPSQLEEPRLGAVVIPLTVGEHAQLLDNFRLWSKPAFFPFLGQLPKRAPDLIFICNTAEAASIEEQLRKFLRENEQLGACFGQVEFINLELSGAADMYRKENHGTSSEFGWRAGPNHLFFGAIERLKGHWGDALYIETDCVPLRPDWLGTLNKLVSGVDRAWVTGSIYRGADPIGPKEKRHINGNAIYATSDPAFHSFVETVWRPMLEETVQIDQSLAFDCVLEALYRQADSKLGDDDPHWVQLRAVSHKFRYSGAIVNLTSMYEEFGDLDKQVSDVIATSPDACIAHSRRLAERIGPMLDGTAAPSLTQLVRIDRNKGILPRPEAAMQRKTVTPRAPWSLERIANGVQRRLALLAKK